MDITINTIGGNCPVQGDGVINGHPWYFRARGALTIDIADNPDADPWWLEKTTPDLIGPAHAVIRSLGVPQ